MNWFRRAKTPEEIPVARYVDAVDLVCWLNDEIAETMDLDQIMGLEQARNHVLAMEWFQ